MKPMDIDLEQALTYQIANAAIREYPFPHFYIRDIFPAEFYAKIQQNMPSDGEYICINDTGRIGGAGYPERFIIDLNTKAVEKLTTPFQMLWGNIAQVFTSRKFLNQLMKRFGAPLDEQLKKFGKPNLVIDAAALLVRDRSGYEIGPHTDSPSKILTLLFYLPKDDSLAHLGTSFFVPKDPEFRCSGGPHYPFSDFKKVMTAGFLPNTLLGFMRNDVSFHGVDKVTGQNIERNLIIFNVKVGGAR